MNKTVGVIGASILLASVVGCTPTLKPFLIAPDNAKTQGITTIGPNQHGGVMTINAMSPDAVAGFIKLDAPPICTVNGGKAAPGGAFGDIQGRLADWTKARANAVPGPSAAAQGSATKNSAQGSVDVKGGSDIITGPLEGDALNILKSLAIDCSADKPVMTVNGEARPVDMIFASTRTTGASLQVTSAGATHVTVLAGWNAATNELTLVRAHTGFASEQKQDAQTWRHWNAVIYRNLEGYVPANTMPITARQMDGAAQTNNDLMEIVFPMTGMAIKADAMLVRGPYDAQASTEAPEEWLELNPIVKRK